MRPGAKRRLVPVLATAFTCAVALTFSVIARPALADEAKKAEAANKGETSTSIAAPVTAPLTANDPGYVLLRRPEKMPSGKSECVFMRTIDGFTPLNAYNLIIYAPSRNHPYHVELNFPCHNLRWAEAIALSSRSDGNLCDYGGDAILVRGDGGHIERCTVGRITRLTDEGLARLKDQKPGVRASDLKDADLKDNNTKATDTKDGGSP